jgi:hypothetical protein
VIRERIAHVFFRHFACGAVAQGCHNVLRRKIYMSWHRQAKAISGTARKVVERAKW